MTQYETMLIAFILFAMGAFIFLAVNTMMNTYNEFIDCIDRVEKDEKECKIL